MFIDCALPFATNVPSGGVVGLDPPPNTVADQVLISRRIPRGDSTQAVLDGLELKHATADGVPVWRFHVLAFMSKKPGVSQVALDFYTDDKTHAFVAQERLAGIDKDLSLLDAQVDLSEDDGLSANKTYVVKLTAEVRGKEVVLATTKLRTR